MTFRPVAPEFFRADGGTDGQRDRLTDMMKLIVAIRNSANAPKYLFI